MSCLWVTGRIYRGRRSRCHCRDHLCRGFPAETPRLRHGRPMLRISRSRQRMIAAQPPSLRIFISAQTVPGADMSSQCPPYRSGSTAHDHHTAVATPHHRFCPRPPLSHRHWPPAADRNLQRRLRLAKPGTSNTRSLSRSDPGPPKPAFRWSLNPPPCLEPTNHIKHRRQIPIDRHQRRCKLPPRFPPSRLFGRLPPCTPSRPCLAGIRKPLTTPDLRGGAREWGGSTVSGS